MDLEEISENVRSCVGNHILATQLCKAYRSQIERAIRFHQYPSINSGKFRLGMLTQCGGLDGEPYEKCYFPVEFKSYKIWTIGAAFPFKNIALLGMPDTTSFPEGGIKELAKIFDEAGYHTGTGYSVNPMFLIRSFKDFESKLEKAHPF